MNLCNTFYKSNKRLAVVAVVVIYFFGIGSLSTGNRLFAQQLPNHGTAAGQKEKHAGMEASESVVDASKETTLYVCPMYCVPPMKKPGNCPVCGMKLVPAAAGTHHHEDGPTRIQLSREMVRAAGIQVAAVEKKFVTAEVRLFGKIEYDPVEEYKVSAFAPGIIDRIYVKRAGQTVRRGDPLFDMHSSELFFLEQDLFALLKQFPDTFDYRPARGQRYKRLMRPARRSLRPRKGGPLSPAEKEALKAAQKKLVQIQRKMQLLGLSQADIENVMTLGRPSGISTVTTPTTGVVVEQYAFKGTYVNTGDTIFTIANPRNIWAKLDAYESDFAWIRLGQEAEFQTDSYPGETFKGKVLYLDPNFDPNTKTFKVGVLYTDPKVRLKPNMLVRCVIHARMTEVGVSLPGRTPRESPPMVIPDSAPLITGSRAIVYVEVSGRKGTYEAREIVLGPRAKGYYVVKAGLHVGERVVKNGNFKIDSAVQILAKPSMMEQPGGEITISQPAHEGGHITTSETSALQKREGSLKGPQHKLYGGAQNRN